MSILKILFASGKAKAVAAGITTIAGGILLYQSDAFGPGKSGVNGGGQAAGEAMVQTGIHQDESSVAVELRKEEEEAIETLIETETNAKVLRAEEEKKKQSRKRGEVIVF